MSVLPLYQELKVKNEQNSQEVQTLRRKVFKLEQALKESENAREKESRKYRDLKIERNHLEQ